MRGSHTCIELKSYADSENDRTGVLLATPTAPDWARERGEGDEAWEDLTSV
jgi:hypothetical protein